MTRSVYLSANRGLLTIVCCLFTLSLLAQRPKQMPSSFDSFLDTQWWLGIRFGANFSQPFPSDKVSAFSPIDYETSELEKDYHNFQDIGAMAGMDISFYHKGISIGLQPSYKHVNYSYTSERQWFGTGGETQFATQYDVSQYVNFLEIPLVLQYEIYRRGQISPFVFGGLFYSFVISAGKDAKVTYFDYSSGGGVESPGGQFSIGVTKEFQNYFGALGGLGAAFDYFNVRTILAASYQQSFRSITDREKQYRDNELSSLGEANDKINLNNINVSVSLVFPLRYIDKTFQPY
ncbi:PorT family protein [Marinoscillum sp. MHG1-6]|uniref:PorT family protein n=1 Tax=Marinoscillum sp. MHG1-6 TaxID=2959627 RepID=UPI002156FCFD|nr:PorT family protein [Marinoscillum sp. MHG1-6]